ncbi:hypothetical protein A3Q56_06714 [Intoshia linei]|uniref:Phosphoribosyltransferase domain-containing protein n=1 Tax=Intoshia linei TaxID=1819745 RepID=A0A177AW26_9BILA|nr:hypothetical protein A3Q56_06714 [Intoshia linei]
MKFPIDLCNSDIANELNKNKDQIETWMLPHVKDLIIPKYAIQECIKSLAREIHKKYKRSNKILVLICILKGANRFTNDITNCLNILNNGDDYLEYQVEFIRIKSRINTDISKNVEIISLLDENNLKEKNLLIIEDIIDSGTSLMHSKNYLDNLNIPFEVVTLVSKVEDPNLLKLNNVTYYGFAVPKDAFIVGYGLDYNQKFRNLDNIVTLTEKSINEFKKK